jgi:electron transfer flavoprotein beta subunit
VTYVQNIREIKEHSVVVERALEDGYEVIEVQRPCLLTAIKELNEPRYMTIAQIEEAYKKEIKVWNENDVNVSPEVVGLKGSPTQVFRSFTPDPKGKGEMLTGTVNEMVNALVAKLTEKHVL